MIGNNSPFEIISFDILPLRLNFRLGVEHGLASRNYTENVIVRTKTCNGNVGYGECVPRIYVTGETIDSVKRSIKVFFGELTGRVYNSSSELIEHISTIGTSGKAVANPAAFCAFELAVLDAAGKQWEAPVYDILGLTERRESATYSMVIPMLDERKMDYLLARVKEYGFKHIKIKVDDKSPVKTVEKVRSYLGNDIELRVDANCSWTMENAPEFIKSLLDLGVVSFEQPLGKDNLDGMSKLRIETGCRISLDESVAVMPDFEKALKAGAGDILNVRVSKCGGLLCSIRLINKTLSSGMEVQLGAQVGESCILSSAGAVIAGGFDNLIWCEGFFGTHLLETDICKDYFRFGQKGKVCFPSGHGLGAPVSDDILDHLVGLS